MGEGWRKVVVCSGGGFGLLSGERDGFFACEER